MIDYTYILINFYPKTKWILNGDEYEGLEWLDESPKPTKEELDAKWPEAEALRESKKVEAQAKREALLERLGITEEEAKLLLG